MIRAAAQERGILPPPAHPHILDIDLDYFRTEKSMRPSDPTTFRRLARGALAITIAPEPGFVQDSKLDGEDIDSDKLLGGLIQQINSSPIP